MALCKMKWFAVGSLVSVVISQQKKIKSLLRPFCYNELFLLVPSDRVNTLWTKDQSDKFLSFNISLFKLLKSTKKRHFVFPNDRVD